MARRSEPAKNQPKTAAQHARTCCPSCASGLPILLSLRPRGALVIGLVDRDSALGRHYEDVHERTVFYREATFYSTAHVEHTT